MKRISRVLLCLVMLMGCTKAKTRTEVIDVLKDNGFSKNTAGFYELQEDRTVFRIGYRSTYQNYTESLYSIFGEGPVITMDVLNDGVYNYQINEDLMYYSYVCSSEETKETARTEIAYKYNDDDFIIGINGCSYDTTNQDNLIETFKDKREIALQKMDTLGLTKKDLNNLKQE